MQFMIAKVSNFRLFYRDALRPPKPTIVLLHGFPLSLRQFHDLLPNYGGSVPSQITTSPELG